MHLVSHQAYILERAYNVPNKKNLPLTKFFHIGVLGNAFLSFTHGAALKASLTLFRSNSLSSSVEGIRAARRVSE